MSSFVNYRVKRIAVPDKDANGNDIQRELEVVSMEMMRSETIAETGNIVSSDSLYFVCFDKNDFNRVWVVPVETEGEIKIARYEINEFRRGYKANSNRAKTGRAANHT